MGEAAKRAERPWSEEDDRFLMTYGWCVGVDFIARHDLGRTPKAARARLAWLRANRPGAFRALWRARGTGPEALRHPWDRDLEMEARLEEASARYALAAGFVDNPREHGIPAATFAADVARLRGPGAPRHAWSMEEAAAFVGGVAGVPPEVARAYLEIVEELDDAA